MILFYVNCKNEVYKMEKSREIKDYILKNIEDDETGNPNKNFLADLSEYLGEKKLDDYIWRCWDYTGTGVQGKESAEVEEWRLWEGEADSHLIIAEGCGFEYKALKENDLIDEALHTVFWFVFAYIVEGDLTNIK